MPSFSFRNVSASAVLEGYQRGVADWSLTLDEIIFLAIFAHPVRKMPLRYGADFKISRELFARDSFRIVGEIMHYEQPYLTAEGGDLHHGAGHHRKTPATPAAMARRGEVFHADWHLAGSALQNQPPFGQRCLADHIAAASGRNLNNATTVFDSLSFSRLRTTSLNPEEPTSATRGTDQRERCIRLSIIPK